MGDISAVTGALLWGALGSLGALGRQAALPLRQRVGAGAHRVLDGRPQSLLLAEHRVAAGSLLPGLPARVSLLASGRWASTLLCAEKPLSGASLPHSRA